MTTRKVLSYPDPRLREISEPVTQFDDELKTIVQDMVDTIEVMGGAGLAAPQIGVHKRVLVIKSKLFVEESPDASYSPETWVLVNPVIRASGSTQRWSEACLSVPLGSGNVDRHEDVEVKYQRLDGTENTVTVKWPLSGALQHEADHLNGILYIDHLGTLERSLVVRKVEKMHKRLSELAEAKKEQEILDLRGSKALLKYRAEKAGQAVPEKRRDKPGKKFGRLKKRK
jgi:peptide deformylase